MMIDYNAKYTLRAFRCNDLVGNRTRCRHNIFYIILSYKYLSSNFLYISLHIPTWPTISFVLCTNHNSRISAFDENDIITFSATMYVNIMKFARLDCLKFGNVCQKVIQYTQNMITYHPLRTIYIRIIIDAQLYDRAKIHCVTNFVLSLKLI